MRRFSPALILFLLACAPADSAVEEAFCDLLINGPEVDIVATDDPATAPEAFLDATKLEIGLVDDEDGFFGYAAFTPDEAGTFALGLGDDVPIAVLDANGTPLPWEAEIRDSPCAELKVRYSVALELASYTLEIGPTELPEIEFVAEESDDDVSR